MSVISVNDVALNYREMGSRQNPTIVFAHALLWDCEVFDRLMTELADDFYIIAVDVHGHGRSGYRTTMSLEEMTEDYYRLITQLDLSQVIWVGFSIGGMLGMRLAVAHPEIIAGLILIATSARLDPIPIREQTWKLWQLFRDGHREDIADPALAYFFAQATYNNQPQLVEQHRQKLIAYQHVEGMFAAARAVFDRTDISEQIAAIKVPTLVLAGKEDPATLPVESEVIALRIPNAQLAILDHASHMLILEKPEAVTQIIREFLN